ncbi:MAG: hypothetical protein ACRDKI_04100 [Solirubrobacterales bacterium]
MSDDKKTIQIGFRSGESVGLKLEPEEFDKLIQAIKDETPWHEVKTEKGTLNLRADRVDYYGTQDEKEERRAGF